MTGTVVNLIAGGSAVLGGSLRLVLARRQLTPATVHLCVAVIAVGLSAALSAPAVLAAAARVEPAPNLSRLLANAAAMAGAWCVQSMLLHLVATERDRASEGVRRQAVILLATLTAMAALFLSAGTTYRPDFLSAFARLPEIAGYLLLFSGYIAWSLIRLVLLIGRYVELTDRRWLQRGLRTLQAGAGFGVAWAAHKVVAATTVFLTGVSYPGAELLAVVLPAAAVVLVAVGLVLPTCAPPVARRVSALRRRQRYRVLGGLWQTLSPVITELRPLGQPPGSTPHERLSIRVVDILDALLVLSPHRDRPAPTTRTPEDARREAGEITTALARWSAGVPPARRGTDDSPDDSAEGAVAASATTVDDLDGEAAWLCRVARAMRRLPPPVAPDTGTRTTRVPTTARTERNP
ncbi:MAB_1171c family putative transporter [Saccharomonospora azurea]